MKTRGQIAVLAWMADTGIRETGRLVYRDRNYVPEIESCPEPKACVWSSDPARFEEGETYAKENKMHLFILEDCPDVLNIARLLVSIP